MNTNNHKYLYNIYFANDVFNCERFNIIYENNNFVVILLKSKNDILKIDKCYIKNTFKCENENFNYSLTNYSKYFFELEEEFNSAEVTTIATNNIIDNNISQAKRIMDFRYNSYLEAKAKYDRLVKNKEKYLKEND